MANGKTVEALTGRVQGVMPTSQEITASARVAPAKIQVGDSLAKDIMGLVGTAGKVVQHKNTLSVNAAKRIAIDKNTELAMFIEEGKQRTNQNDPQALRQLQANISQKQLELTNVLFENEDAQRVFDEGYTMPSGVSVAGMIGSLETSALDIDDEQNNTKVLSDLNVQLNAGVRPTSDSTITMVDSMTARKGEQAKPAAYLKIAQSHTLEFANRYKNKIGTILKNNGWNNVDGLTLDVKQSIFSSAFGNVAQLKGHGDISFQDTFQGEPAREEIRRSWAQFMTTANSTINPSWDKSTIPKSASSMFTDGSISHNQSQQKVQLATDELNKRKALNANIIHDDRFKDLEGLTDKMRVQSDIIGNNTASYSAFIQGDDTMTWKRYLEDTTSSAYSYFDRGNPIHIKQSIGTATTFAQKQFDAHEEKLRISDYFDLVKDGENPFSAAGKIQSRSGDKLQSTYLGVMSGNLLEKRSVAGDSFKSVKSEYLKAVDFTKSRGSYGGSWVEKDHANILTALNTIEYQLNDKKHPLKEEDAFIRAKSVIEAFQEDSKIEKSHDPIGVALMKETLDNFDADDAMEYGIINFGWGNDEWVTGAKTRLQESFYNKMMTSDIGARKTFIAQNVVAIRQESDITGVMSLPFRKNLIIYTGGVEITSDNASMAISQRVRSKLGNKYKDITSDNVATRMSKNNAGEPILLISISQGVNQPSTDLFTFTMHELSRGEVEYGE